MNRLPSTVRQLIAALRGLLLFTVLCGIIYPVFMFGVAQVAFHHQANGSQVPADAVTTSASGLDPYISPQNAAIQVDRVAAARHVSPAAIMALVRQYTKGRTLGFLGEPRVTVLTLNIALDQRYPV